MTVCIPARDEERALPSCLTGIAVAAARYDGPVEVVVAANRCTDRTEEIARRWGATVVVDGGRSIAATRNAAAAAATGSSLVFLDADCVPSPSLLEDVGDRLADPRVVGGGVATRPDRWSPGIALTGLVLAGVCAWNRVAAGSIWCRTEDFRALGGFDESLVSAEDLDFCRRLRGLGRTRGQRFVVLLRSGIVSSTRKFDEFGDWYLLRHPRLVRDILGGRSREAADAFYYDIERPPPP
jgi:glycosyltransferase involved in cell wall biosynthesis